MKYLPLNTEIEALLEANEITPFHPPFTPLSPPFAPVQRQPQSPPAKSKFLAVQSESTGQEVFEAVAWFKNVRSYCRADFNSEVRKLVIQERSSRDSRI